MVNRGVRAFEWLLELACAFEELRLMRPRAAPTEPTEPTELRPATGLVRDRLCGEGIFLRVRVPAGREHAVTTVAPFAPVATVTAVARVARVASVA